MITERVDREIEVAAINAVGEIAREAMKTFDGQPDAGRFSFVVESSLRPFLKAEFITADNDWLEDIKNS